MEGGATGLGKEALWGRLAAGHAARTTVVTPNRRLAQALLREFGDRQVAQGLSTWETPDILPFPAFVERLWSDALHSDRGASVPALLGEAQELALWEQCIHASGLDNGLMSVAFAAAQSSEAWKLVHAWSLRARLAAAPNHDDAKIFLDWAERYEKITAARRCTDAARLPDIVKPLLGRGVMRLPSAVTAFAFDAPTPQQRALFEALRSKDTEVSACGPDAKASKTTRIAFPSGSDEIAACARWARARMEAGATRIGIVAPDLARSRRAIARALANALVPGHALPGMPRRALPFEISLAPPLDQYPVVSHALSLLRLCGLDLEFEPLSRLVRSPFVGGAETERSQRARLDVELRRRSSAVMTLEGLRKITSDLGSRTPLLEQWLVRLVKFRHDATLGKRSHSAWARAFTEALDIAGFPGERTLDSAEYQALAKWHELLAELATLDRVGGLVAFKDAWERLSAMARTALFQPKGSNAPVQVLGILESAGLEFDHLWVLGLTDEAWPLAERANPFVSMRLQREAGIPQADANASLELDRRITQSWLVAADEVIVSHAQAESDRELFMSPLIGAVAAGTMEALALPVYESLPDAIRRGTSLEHREDREAPAITVAFQPHGTRLFKDQAACPFRGFAHHRLNAGKLDAPTPGVDARERGTLLHTALSVVWRELVDKASLDALSHEDRDALLARAVEEAISRVRERRPDALGGRFGNIERTRLVSHLGKWLDFEARREDFTVVANERKSRLTFGGVEVEARLDRMDRLAGAGHAVIDYKTGEAKIGQWLGDRPDEPQLPMYALGAEESVDAVVFARVKAGEFCFTGIARTDNLLPNVRTIDKNRARLARGYRNWDDLVGKWRIALEAIGAGYARGDASVVPREGPATCKLCDQHTFCRVSERLPVGMPSAEGADDA